MRGCRRSSTAHRPQPYERPQMERTYHARLHVVQHAALAARRAHGTLEYHSHGRCLATSPRGGDEVRLLVWAPAVERDLSTSEGVQPPRQLELGAPSALSRASRHALTAPSGVVYACRPPARTPPRAAVGAVCVEGTGRRRSPVRWSQSGLAALARLALTGLQPCRRKARRWTPFERSCGSEAAPSRPRLA